MIWIAVDDHMALMHVCVVRQTPHELQSLVHGFRRLPSRRGVCRGMETIRVPLHPPTRTSRSRP
jgi:hypothetical protein